MADKTGFHPNMVPYPADSIRYEHAGSEVVVVAKKTPDADEEEIARLNRGWYDKRNYISYINDIVEPAKQQGRCIAVNQSAVRESYEKASFFFHARDAFFNVPCKK